jgi:hypothetical protein
MVSKHRILFYSISASFSVLLVSLILQWLVYDDWLHQTGPLHVFGSTLSAVVTFIFVLRWFRAARQRNVEAQRRFAIIARANDRIRNKLQAIECLTYASDRSLTESVREAIDGIDEALRGMVEESATGESAAEKPQTSTMRAGSGAVNK